ncbi:MAG: hypothetical protein HC933_21260 [Pleurocapsa sp. SU_196_0]|nr:hypothetical protein [Pleurocapsa sp. SU_196_0]
MQIEPDWEGERRSFMLRPVLAFLPLMLAFTGLMEARLAFAVVVAVVSVVLLILDYVAIQRRWRWIAR